MGPFPQMTLKEIWVHVLFHNILYLQCTKHFVIACSNWLPLNVGFTQYFALTMTIAWFIV